MAKAKKSARKAAPKARKAAPKAAKKKLAMKPRAAARSSKPKRSAKLGQSLERKVAAIVTAATRTATEIESAAARMERAAVRKVAEVATKAGKAVAKAANVPFPESKVPSYSQLPIRKGAPDGSAWGVFGDNDEVGTINLLTPERVVAAAASIRTGKVFALNLPITIPDPPLFTRGKHTHVVKIFPTAPYVLDDYLDNFYPQASSQWDALAHVKHPEFGAYNGIPDREITGRGGKRLGIDNLARRGIAGRGVLADVARYYDRLGKRINYTKPESIPLEDVQATLAHQESPLCYGDVLLIRIGWTKFYLSASTETKEELAKETVVPGIEGSKRVARWLWDNHLAAVASDSPALEALPKSEGQDFLHFHMLAFFGMPIGEMWNLEGLAEDCAEDRRYDFFITSAPLNIPGGVGSPPNAIAVK